jgi:hypothetical protein
VTISCSTPSNTIYYTIDGSIPTTSSLIYAGSITISSSETLNAICVAPGYNNSPVASVGVVIQIPMSSGGGSSGSGGGGGGGYYIPPSTTSNATTTTGISGTESSSLNMLLSLVTEVRLLSLQMFLNSNKGRNLTIGSTGNDVWAIQVYLITNNVLSSTGPAGGKLINPTSYFGSLTKNALAEYQAQANIFPASGFLGPKTYSYLESIFVK